MKVSDEMDLTIGKALETAVSSRQKFFLLCKLTKLSQSVWEIPYRPPAQLIRAKNERIRTRLHLEIHFEIQFRPNVVLEKVVNFLS